MKRFLLFLFLIASIAVTAQPFNNEWIDYSKTYFKFKVGSTGLYRIDQSVLPAAINTANAQDFQLWRNGKEIPLYTSRQAGAFQSGDYIEFWGEMNDAKPEHVMYRMPDFQLNDKWSLQTDTAVFFLTINPGAANLRLLPKANNVSTNTLPPEPFFLHIVGKYWKDRLGTGWAQVVGDNVYSSSYDQGEGWTSSDLIKDATFTQVFNDLRVYTGPGAPTEADFKIHASGYNGLNQRVFRVKINGDSIIGQQMNYFDYKKVNKAIPTSLIASNTATVEITNQSQVLPNVSDRMVVAQIELKYPREFNFGGASNFVFELPASPIGNYLEISNFNWGSSTPVLYDLVNFKRYVADIVSNPLVAKFALEPTLYTQSLVLVSEQASNVKAVTSFQQRNFVNYALPANQGNYLIITHPILLNGSNGTLPIDDYVAYRNSATGGGYNSKVYMIDQLVDQFGLGIKFHPLSVRNFLRWARSTFNNPIRSVFLIGKGMHYGQFRSNEGGADIDKLALIPTFGHPASDILLAAEPGTNMIPQTPIGRLSVVYGDEISVYLQKVKEYEQQQAFQSPLIADKAWMKNVGHVVGASDEGLNTTLENSMETFRKIIVDTFYGGNVHTFSKTSAEAVEVANSVRIQNLFNEGMGLLTYFGHSSAATLEFNLDNPQNYDNVGKYPLFILLGCNAGNYYNYTVPRLITKETISEKFVLAPNRGCIATIASSSLGIVYYLNIYNSRNYSSIASWKYGATMGDVMKEAITQVYGFTGQGDFYSRVHCEQASLHGDPAIKLNTFAKPDYVIEDPLVTITPAFISVAEPNFSIKAKFMNIGKAINDSISITVKRIFPDGSEAIVEKDTIRGIHFMDSLSYILPIETAHKGVNKIVISVDADQKVDELYETNNSITKEFVVYEDEIRPVYPYNYAIVRTQGLKLSASTANAFVGVKQYRMELDTSKLFNSPFLVTRNVSSTGGMVEFDPGISYTDSTVYYWRVALIPPTGTPNWKYASFIYIPNYSAGFNQSHYYQHQESNLHGLVLRPDRKWAYDSILQNIFVRNTVYPTGGTQQSEFTISVNDEPYIGPGCGSNSIIINVFAPNSLKTWKNDFSNGTSGLYESMLLNCGAKREYNFEYEYRDTSSRRKMMTFLRDIVPNGYYVVLRGAPPPTTPIPAAYTNVWQDDTLLYGSGVSLYHILKNEGFNDLDSFNRPRTFIFMYKKGDHQTFPSRSVFTDGIYDRITLNVDIMTPDSIGTATSPLFGPAQVWKKMYWKESAPLDAFPGDSVALNIIGVAPNGTETPLVTGINTGLLEYDISGIDPAAYPYLRLQLVTKDTSLYTPYQLKQWRLTYDPMPEGALIPNIYYQGKDTVDVGEPLTYGVAFKNISETPFPDSMKVIFTIRNHRTNVLTDFPLNRRKDLQPGDSIKVDIPVDTRLFQGANTVFFHFNPNIMPEQYQFNNYGFKNLYVRPDSLNPLMDVTFDGTHILNRDIVSAKPEILIKLKDEARWMVLDDTSLLTIKVKFPDGSSRRYYFNNDTLQFTPAGQAPNPDNTAMVSLKPYFTQDGEYELSVTGRDMSNNAAGALEYKVSFQVVNKPMISNMLNYPNPFTTSTAFVFTITGSEVPQNIRIQVMTITGKIVREITKDELGPLRVGRNITEFKWDGTDQYGQKLANGVYLYRVITNLNGKSLDKYTSYGEDTDKYFNKGYGKMYLMR
jgi:hypothetical protein